MAETSLRECLKEYQKDVQCSNGIEYIDSNGNIRTAILEVSQPQWNAKDEAKGIKSKYFDARDSDTGKSFWINLGENDSIGYKWIIVKGAETPSLQSLIEGFNIEEGNMNVMDITTQDITQESFPVGDLGNIDFSNLINCSYYGPHLHPSEIKAFETLCNVLISKIQAISNRKSKGLDVSSQARGCRTNYLKLQHTSKRIKEGIRNSKIINEDENIICEIIWTLDKALETLDKIINDSNIILEVLESEEEEPSTSTPMIPVSKKLINVHEWTYDFGKNKSKTETSSNDEFDLPEEETEISKYAAKIDQVLKELADKNYQLEDMKREIRERAVNAQKKEEEHTKRITDLSEMVKESTSMRETEEKKALLEKIHKMEQDMKKSKEYYENKIKEAERYSTDYEIEISELRKEVSDLKIRCGLTDDENMKLQDDMRNLQDQVDIEKSFYEEDKEKKERIQEVKKIVGKMSVLVQMIKMRMPAVETAKEVRRFKLDQGRKTDLLSQQEKLFDLLSEVMSLRGFDSAEEILPEEWSESLQKTHSLGMKLIHEINEYLNEIDQKAEEWNIYGKDTTKKEVTKPDSLDGLNLKNTVYDWLAQFSHYCKAAEIPIDEQGVSLKSLLKDSAKELVNFELPNVANPSPEKVKEILIKEYGEKKSVIKSLIQRHKDIGRIPIYTSAEPRDQEISKKSIEHLSLIRSMEAMIKYYSGIGKKTEILGNIDYLDYIDTVENALPENKVFDFLDDVSKAKTIPEKIQVAKSMLEVVLDFARKRIISSDQDITSASSGKQKDSGSFENPNQPRKIRKKFQKKKLPWENANYEELVDDLQPPWAAPPKVVDDRKDFQQRQGGHEDEGESLETNAKGPTNGNYKPWDEDYEYEGDPKDLEEPTDGNESVDEAPNDSSEADFYYD